ncbi:ParB-like nuclease family protein [Kitasatospora cineracea]|uniref:ParB-like nuclease family protein n=2 Tax=Kitasatospora cineracea TaxID=88074 RepID=A0A3N4S425_9ACTN|nr:ParB-like nuclease family protein [Kitasatospora cineracea]
MAREHGRSFGDAGQSVRMVPVKALLPADSPRLAGVDETHARAMAESDTDFPPILVRRDEQRVVDGMHRLRATVLRGEQHIAVQYVEGSPADLFVRSVQVNARHGLPLTPADRRTAVNRILATHPHWSDRAVAAVAGVSPKTVGAARRRLSTGETPQSNPLAARLGKDGRLRPVDIRARRERARCLLMERPGVTLRAVAEETGISISTVHRLRQELRSDAAHRATAERSGRYPGIPPQSGPRTVRRMVLAARPAADEPERSAAEPFPKDDDLCLKALEVLAHDPSIRFTDSGRALLRWLSSQARGLDAAEQLFGAVPPHCAKALAEVASHYSRAWNRLSNELGDAVRAHDSWPVAR